MNTDRSLVHNSLRYPGGGRGRGIERERRKRREMRGEEAKWEGEWRGGGGERRGGGHDVKLYLFNRPFNPKPHTV